VLRIVEGVPGKIIAAHHRSLLRGIRTASHIYNLVYGG
jgi:hypothetical protein